jgi:hypothetical protein
MEEWNGGMEAWRNGGIWVDMGGEREKRRGKETVIHHTILSQHQFLNSL